MRRQEEGFTLIELVMVIVILGILAAVAVPRYLNLTAEAQIATTNAAASSAGSAVAIAAARNRNATGGLAPTPAMVLAEIPGATCPAGVIVQGKVNVTLIGEVVGGAQIPVIATCAQTGNTIVTSVGQGVYSV